MKECNHKGCSKPVFGGGMCVWHQSFRTDKKRTDLKRTPIPKMRPKNKPKILENKALAEKDKAFYAQIWEDRPHISFESGIYLGEEPLTIFFHHLLAKSPTGRYAKFRHEKWNIALLSFEEHNKENYLKFLPRVKAYRDYLIENLDLIEAGKLEPLKTFKHELVLLDGTQL